jgi:hypothetical protein
MASKLWKLPYPTHCDEIKRAGFQLIEDRKGVDC